MSANEPSLMEQDTSAIKMHEENPPILGSWSRLYGVVLLELVVLVALFYLFTKAFE